MEQTGSKLGKCDIKAVYFYGDHIQSDSMQSTSCEMLVWKAQAGIKTAGRNINDLRYADDTTLAAESEEEPKSLLMKVKEESEKFGLAQHSENEDYGIWSHHFMGHGWGNSKNSVRLYFEGAPNSLQMVLQP